MKYGDLKEKRIGKFLRIKELDSITDKKRFLVKSNDNETLAEIEYTYRWKIYILCTFDNTIFSGDCLDDISKFLKELNNE